LPGEAAAAAGYDDKDVRAMTVRPALDRQPEDIKVVVELTA
jgi:hypothetical protein